MKAPGDLLTTSEAFPDRRRLLHVTCDDSPWRDVDGGDLFVVVTVVSDARDMCVLHARSCQVIRINDTTAEWLCE